MNQKINLLIILIEMLVKEDDNGFCKEMLEKMIVKSRNNGFYEELLVEILREDEADELKEEDGIITLFKKICKKHLSKNDVDELLKEIKIEENDPDTLYMEMVELFRDMDNIPKARKILSIYMENNGFQFYEYEGKNRVYYNKENKNYGISEEISIFEACTILSEQLNIGISSDDVIKAINEEVI